MAVGQTGSTGKALKITSSLPSTAVISACGWAVRRAGTASNFPTLFGIESGTSSAATGVYIEMESGTFKVTSNAGATAFGATPTQDKPFFWALTNAGAGAGNEKGYWRHIDGTMNTASQAGQSFTPAQMSLLNDSFDDFWDGYVSDVKVWTRVLSQSELECEMFRTAPAFFTNLYGQWPLWRVADLADYSGNGHTWTAAGSLTDEVSAPIFRGQAIRPVHRHAAAAPPPTGQFWLAAAA